MKKSESNEISGDNAYSTNIGIAISSKHTNGVYVYTYYDDNGSVEHTVIPEDPIIRQFIGVKGAFQTKMTTKKTILIEIAIIILFTIISLLTNSFIPMFIWFFVRFGHVDYDVITLTAMSISIKNDQKSLGRFHSSEHMVLNYYEKYHKIPTLYELKQESRYSSRCGSMMLFLRILQFLIIVVPMPIMFNIIMKYDTFLEPIFHDSSWIFSSTSLVILYGVFIKLAQTLIFTLYKRGNLNSLEVLVTNVPTDYELQLAIKALENREKFDDELKEYNRNMIDSIRQQFERTLD